MDWRPKWLTSGRNEPDPGAAAPLSSVRSRALKLFYALEILAGVAVFAWQAPKLQGDIYVFLGLLVLNVAASGFRISIYRDVYTNAGHVLTMALIILYGAPAVVLAAPLESLADRIVARRIDRKLATNAAVFVISHAAGAAAYSQIAASGASEVSWQIVPGSLVATLVCLALPAFLIGLARSISTGKSALSIWGEYFWIVPHYLALGVIGLSLAAAYMSLGIAGVLAFLTPAVMMRLAIKQYVDKTAENVEKLREQNTALQRANIEIRRVSDELRESYDGTLEALVNALDARDQETKGHSLRVSHYMMDIARELGVKEGSQQWVDFARGSLLHDVGKIGVSDTILLKPGKLTDSEWELMRKHPEIGYHMLRQVKFLQGAADIVLAHHERWDGKGYPKGLREEEIPLGARIFMVCDTFDSMTSDRPYRKAKSTLEALNEILKYSGSQFDPRVVEAFMDIYETWVKERERLHSDTEELRIAA
jgi:putative nucleotidyltransferase with HDIG domain